MGRFIYRGTTRHVNEHSSLSKLGITSASEDALIATLFAIECQRFGASVVLMCDRTKVAELIQPANVLEDLEREIVLGVSPEVFAVAHVEKRLPPQLAREILAELGFELPPTIANKAVLHNLLQHTPRLSEEYLQRFDREALARGY